MSQSLLCYEGYHGHCGVEMLRGIYPHCDCSCHWPPPEPHTRKTHQWWDRGRGGEFVYWAGAGTPIPIPEEYR